MKPLLIVFLIIVVSQVSIAQTSKYDKLADDLDSIYTEDQQYRLQIEQVMQEHGRDSEELRNLFKKIVQTDSSNVAYVKEVLDTHGWLGEDVIGKKANRTLFLVIQHSDLQTQIDYMPLMHKAVEKGNAKPQNFALLKDRVLLGQGKKQLYGSQIGVDQASGQHYVKPLENPENVNERREEMGLGPIEDYVSRWNIEWSVDRYTKDIQKFEDEN